MAEECVRLVDNRAAGGVFTRLLRLCKGERKKSQLIRDVVPRLRRKFSTLYLFQFILNENKHIIFYFTKNLRCVYLEAYRMLVIFHLGNSGNPGEFFLKFQIGSWFYAF
uniref:PUM-HD domain-containing protein n=1 Tax=Ascaris lumbricoides TaxID=6252 RepID=A0A0M3IQU0_ASCLU